MNGQALVYFGISGGTLLLALSLLRKRYVEQDHTAVTSRGGYTMFAILMLIFSIGAFLPATSHGAMPTMPHSRDWPRIVGVLHLPPLPGSARGGTASSMCGIIDAMLRDAEIYREAGIDTVIVENYGDLPFVRDRVDAATTSAMTRVVDAVQREFGLTIGVNVLRNDVLTAVSIAAMTGARFVRANVYVGVMQTESGIIQGCAHAVQQEIKRLGAPRSRSGPISMSSTPRRWSSARSRSRRTTRSSGPSPRH